MRILGILLIIGLFGCTPSEEGDHRTRIVCTTGMIGDAVINLVDSTITVNVLMGPGTDPHLFKPTKNSLDLLASADIIVANGLHLEGRMQDILEKISRKKPVIFIGEGLDEDQLIYGDTKSAIPDPHIWFDVKIWTDAITYLQVRLGELTDLDTESTYLSDLEDLNEWTQSSIENIPGDSRILITAHDAFSYFGRAYGIEVIGLQGISTVSEYGIRDVTNLVDLIIERKVPAVFIESSISSRSIEAVIQGCDQRGHKIKLGGTLYSDALGPKSSGAETYFGMVKSNVNTIVNALK